MNTKKNTKSVKKTKKNTNNKKNDKNLILIKDLELKLEEQKTKNIKLLAEFDNFQKRTILERENARKYDGLNLIKDLLPVFDDIDRTINHKDDVDINSVLEARFQSSLSWGIIATGVNDRRRKSYRRVRKRIFISW